MGRGVINSLPSLGLQVMKGGKGKVSISLQCEKPVIQSSYQAISVPPTSSIKTKEDVTTGVVDLGIRVQAT